MSRAKRIFVVAVLVIGVAGWAVVVGRRPWLWAQFIAVAIALIIALLPGVGPAVGNFIERLRRPSARAARWTAVGVAACAIVLLYGATRIQHRGLYPKMHDESMHLVQMQMLARGKLWMPEHPVAESFETFHVFVTPVYGSIYFPGTSLLYLPTIWLHLPYFVMPLLVSGAAIGLLYWIVTDLLDGAAGLLAAAIVLSLSQFRYIAVLTTSHAAMIFLAMMIVFSWLHWRKTHHIGWAAAVGFFAGWAAITRPLDAVCYAVPVGVAMLWMLRGAAWRTWLATFAALIVPAVPFLALQAVQNVGLTGHVLKTPYQLSAEIYTPGVGLGFPTYDETLRPRTDLPQWQAYHDRFTRKYIKAHRADLVLHTWARDRIPRLMSFTSPSPLLFALLALGLFSLRGPQWVLLSVVPLYLFVYVFFPYFLPHYLTVVAPAIAFGIVLGVETLRRAWPRHEARLTALAAVVIVALCVASLPGIDRTMRDDGWVAPTLELNEQLPQLVQEPAVVLFRYHPDSSPHEEPVYNVDVAWPDDARIIRAHDLGPERNRKLVRYYAERQPDRRFYLVDRQTNSLGYLGVARDLADAPDADLATTRPLPPHNGL